jgi:hypothetical protein
MTRSLGAVDIAWFCVTFEFAMLTATGAAHVLGARRTTALERPRRVGVLELAIAGAALAAAVSRDARAVIATQVIVAVLAAGFAVFLLRLRRASDPRPCGCHPFSGQVVRASFVPAGALGGAAAVLLAGAALDGGVGPVEVGSGLLIAVVGALAAGVSLVYSGAAAPIAVVEGE